MSAIAEDPRSDVNGVEQTWAAWLTTPVELVMATCFMAALVFAGLALASIWSRSALCRGEYRTRVAPSMGDLDLFGVMNKEKRRRHLGKYYFRSHYFVMK